MNFDALQRRVARAEQAVVVHETRTRQQWAQLRTTWRTGWTPGRIVIAGLAAGFLVGRARPLRLAGSGGLLTLLRALAPLLASVQAGMQAAPADGAGTDAAP
ncbi:hypothetical protein [Thermomonas sp.]|uniref:hypothetical protein n=1 Tax=Thermomonas sp. TaxID=1971895 RepID=UPI00391BF872